jgi:tetratricopeptide (TPR) repeat protein
MKRAFVALLLLVTPAFGQDDHLYAEGAYDAAIRAGVARNNAHGFGEAARAALAEEATREQRCLPCLKRAEDFARRAMAADPKLADARVYLALSLGLEARIEGYDLALRKGYATEAKQALEEAHALDPKNVWALAGLGGWNIEVVRGGGKVLAYLLYGATLERGQTLFAQALNQAPDNIAIRFQYALTLSGYDVERYREKIEALLTRVVEGPAETAYLRLLQKRAAELQSLLRKSDADGYAARVRQYEGYVTTTTG